MIGSIMLASLRHSEDEEPSPEFVKPEDLPGEEAEEWLEAPYPWISIGDTVANLPVFRERKVG